MERDELINEGNVRDLFHGGPTLLLLICNCKDVSCGHSRVVLRMDNMAVIFCSHFFDRKGMKHATLTTLGGGD